MTGAQRLRDALAGRYTIEREVGRGGIVCGDISTVVVHNWGAELRTAAARTKP